MMSEWQPTQAERAWREAAKDFASTTGAPESALPWQARQLSASGSAAAGTHARRAVRTVTNLICRGSIAYIV